MFKFIAYSKNQAGEFQEAALKTADNNGVLAVYADSVSRDKRYFAISTLISLFLA